MPDSASGRVHDPAVAEVLLQALGDAEDTAEPADVLAHHRGPCGSCSIAARRPALRALTIVMLVSCAPPPRSSRARRRTRPAARAVSAVPSTKTWSNRSARSGSGSCWHASRRCAPSASASASSVGEELRRACRPPPAGSADPVERVLGLPRLDLGRPRGSGSGRPTSCGRPSGRSRPRSASGPGRRGPAAAPAVVTAWQARTSLPSTRTPGRPKPSARCAIGTRVWVARPAPRSRTGCSGRRTRPAPGRPRPSRAPR